MSTQKTLDFNRNVHDLVTEYPEVADIMAALGFSETTLKNDMMFHMCYH